MIVYFFGNRDLDTDNAAHKVAAHLKKDFFQIVFQEIKLNEDLPFSGQDAVIIMDTVIGIDKVTLLNENSLDKLILPPKSTVHDYDLGFQLKYLKKLDKLKQITIIGLPTATKVDYDSLHSILRKLVAQDIHGS